MDWRNLVADKRMWLPAGCYEPGRRAKIDRVVVHHNAGCLTTEGAYALWSKSGTSAHYQVERDGTVGQLVHDSDAAWHCPYQNQRAIGVEHANNQFGPWTVSDATLDAGAHLVAALCLHYGLGRPEWGVNVFGHRDLWPTACPGELGAGGSQHGEYCRRMGEWYDRMAGGAPAAETKEAFVAIGSVTNGVYRLYNPNSGDHVFTASLAEANSLAKAGWAYEGVAFRCDPNGEVPVYRLYNPNTGAHMLTASRREAMALKGAGWSDEGVAFRASA